MQRKIDWTPGTRFEKKKKRMIYELVDWCAPLEKGGEKISAFLKEKWKL